MPKANFCAECGDRLPRTGWRAWLRARLCAPCAHRLGTFAAFRGLLFIILIAAAAFGFGRYLRPAPPPLIIQRLANSPLPDNPVELQETGNLPRENANTKPSSPPDENGYMCGARTRKGTPCRRRVHAAGERCFQHKGLPAMLPLEKLVIKSK